MFRSLNLYIVVISLTALGCNKSHPELTEQSQVNGDSNVASSPEQSSIGDSTASIEALVLEQNEPVKDAFFWLAVEDEFDLGGLDGIEKNVKPTIVAQEDRFAPRCLVVHGNQIVFRAQERAANIGYTDQTWSMNIQPYGEVVQKVEINKVPGRIYNDLIENYGDAYLLVLNHPFGAVAKDDGVVKISGVPRGKFTIRAWHPDLGFPESIAFAPNLVKQKMNRGKYELELVTDLTRVQVNW